MSRSTPSRSPAHAAVPSLATECVANEDQTEWTCSLREGVKFHDGSDFTASDVVTSYASMWDAENPLHVGNSGQYSYWSGLWRQLPEPARGQWRRPLDALTQDP